jgi:hypothetical protein
MKIQESTKAKYVFDELALGDVVSALWEKIGKIVVYQDEMSFEYTHWERDGKKLFIFDGEANQEEEEPMWVFSLKEKVKVKGSMICFSSEKHAKHQTMIEFLKTTSLDVGKLFKKALEAK